VTEETNRDQSIKITDDLDSLLQVLPPGIMGRLESLPSLDNLLEIVMDLGRLPEARFPSQILFLGDETVTREELDHVSSRISTFGKDNRAGIERTLHRISAIRNRAGLIVGLTCRVGRAVYGTIAIIRDIIESGKSILLLGRPGVGKTTMLREVARVLADEFHKRVIIVDTSNEIAGDGDIPHPAIGGARRMQVPVPELQHAVMIEAVENHMPEVIVVDEIGIEVEAYAARTIAERGVQLVATAHGNTLENLLMNPTLSDLVGGIQAVTLGDDEARRRKTQKTVLERKAPPTFEVVIEIHSVGNLVLHRNVAEVVDLILRGMPPMPEIRVRDDSGRMEILQTSNLEEVKVMAGQMNGFHRPGEKHTGTVRIYPYAVSRNRLEKSIRELGVPARIVRNLEEADVILAVRGHDRRAALKLKEAGTATIRDIKSNTEKQIRTFLQELFDLPSGDIEETALKETEEAIRDVLRTSQAREISPQNSYIRSLQHKLVESHHLCSRSTGEEPNRRLRIYPDNS
jgi:stage III sporulation protein SpoIIIAA